jgi:16S rRNA (cytidine1402-2'-O)-methyltransferase
MNKQGTLFIVSTPIGNLEDASFRLVRVLKEADIVACEDTRVTSKLLAHCGIKGKKLVSMHQHATQSKLDSIVADVRNGMNVAYASDAGTPNVNDPGGRIAERAHEAGVRIEIIPGPSALTAAIAACGFPMERFSYVGFVPQKKHRAATLKKIADREHPTVFFESTHRIMRTLNELRESLDEHRLIYVGRELTKKFETHLRGTVADVITALEKGSAKGEFVVIVGPKD